VAWLALVAAAISALGIAIILFGIAFDIEGAEEGEEGRAIFDVAWVSYLLGGIAAGARVRRDRPDHLRDRGGDAVANAMHRSGPRSIASSTGSRTRMG
jgi:hypothetical protein